MGYVNDEVGQAHEENGRRLREVGQSKRERRNVSTGTPDAGSSLGEGTPIVDYTDRPVRTRRDELIDASRARRGGRGAVTGDGGGVLDWTGRGPCQRVLHDGSLRVEHKDY